MAENQNVDHQALETIEDLSEYLSFLSCASEDSELCDPGLHNGIRIASLAARNLTKTENS